MKSDVTANGGVIIDQMESDGFSVLTLTKTPKMMSDTRRVDIAIDNRFGAGLQKVLWTSNIITNDPFGTKGKEKYQRLKKLLLKKYGKIETSGEFVGLKLYKDSDEFYECLAYAGCGTYTSIWRFSEEMGIILKLEGLNRGMGYLSLTYQGPRWNYIMNKIDEYKIKADEDAM